MSTIRTWALGLIFGTVATSAWAHDLRVDVALSSTNLVAEDIFDLTITVSNADVVAAPAASITNDIPFQADFFPVENPSVAIHGGRLIWNIGPLNPGATTSLLVQAQMRVDAVPGKWVDVAYAHCGDPSCTNSARGHATGQVTGKSDLRFGVTTSHTAPVEPGDWMDWCFSVTNMGPHTVFGMSFAGLFPPGLSDISWQCIPKDPPAVLAPLLSNEPDGRISAGDGPGQLTWTPDGRYVYVVNFYGDSISRFARDPISGMLHMKPAKSPNGQYEAGDGARILGITPDGKNLYCANSLAGNIYHYRIDPVDGDLTLRKNGASLGYASGNNTRSLGVHPSGKFLYVCNFGDNNLSAFSIHPTTGALSFLPSAQPGGRYASGVGPHAMAFHGDGKNLYVQHREGGDVAHFSVNTSTGTLAKVPSSEANGNYLSGSFTADISISPDNKFLYTCNAYADTYTVYSLNPITGKPARVGVYPCGDWPVAIMMAMEGNYVLMVNNVDEDVRVYRRNKSTGALTHVPASPTVAGYRVGTYPGANGGVTPDGRHIYVCNFGGDDISLFRVKGSTVSPTSGTGRMDGALDIAVGGSVTLCVTGRVDAATAEDLRTGVGVDFRSGRFSLVFPNRSPTGTVDTTHGVYLRDEDADGKPDRWEELNGLDAESHDPEQDSDHDGLSDTQEYVGNTDPRDPVSAVRIKELEVLEDAHVAKYSGSQLRVYTLEYREGPDSPWIPVTSRERGEGSDSELDNCIEHLLELPHLQYRLKAETP